MATATSASNLAFIREQRRRKAIARYATTILNNLPEILNQPKSREDDTDDQPTDPYQLDSPIDQDDNDFTYQPEENQASNQPPNSPDGQTQSNQSGDQSSFKTNLRQRAFKELQKRAQTKIREQLTKKVASTVGKTAVKGGLQAGGIGGGAVGGGAVGGGAVGGGAVAGAGAGAAGGAAAGGAAAGAAAAGGAAAGGAASLPVIGIALAVILVFLACIILWVVFYSFIVKGGPEPVYEATPTPSSSFKS